MRPETLLSHELTGLSVVVESAANADAVGLAGRVIQETTNTLEMRPGEGPLGDIDERSRQVPKRGTTFVVELPAGERVRVAGERLIARPARRGESGGVSPWV